MCELRMLSCFGRQQLKYDAQLMIPVSCAGLRANFNHSKHNLCIVYVFTGTGHGVGAALNVHEGPQRISPLLGPQVRAKPAILCTY